ncbi:hypothetical protein [Methylovulum psychrotolerans]|uniref:hypothetical protein n=1 Tax=Methylovulum psychrotolerans TaxID=1704499 RepID=UPI0012F8DCF3|nr:hypothetical protein [Methylovulum psychrotolerans]
MGFHLAFDGHKSIIVPAVDREAVQAHFEAQAKCFGDGSVSPYPERYLKDSIGDLDNTVHHKLLAEHIMQKNADGRAWLYEQARQLDNATSITQLAASLDPRFGLKGLISLYPVAARFVPFVDMERYAEVLRFRTKVALEICRLPSMEWLVIAIRDSMELGEYPGGVKEEMLAMLEPRLHPYRQLIGFEFPSQAGLKK